VGEERFGASLNVKVQERIRQPNGGAQVLWSLEPEHFLLKEQFESRRRN
jgi:hypothetical protein